MGHFCEKISLTFSELSAPATLVIEAAIRQYKCLGKAYNPSDGVRKNFASGVKGDAHLMSVWYERNLTAALRLQKRKEI